VGAGVTEENNGAEAQASGMPDTAGLAIDLAMEEARGNPALQGHVAAFLDDQRGMIADQRHHMREQYKQTRLGVWEKRLGVLLRLATGVMGLAIAGALGFMVWQASQSNGLLIEPFSVPPDLAGRGLTGQVIAAKVLDRLTLLQSQTNTARPAKSYSNAWDDHGIKLEIPETGVSLAELDSWLREKLGHDTHVTGEIVRTTTGVAITARAGEQGSETLTGSDADVGVLAGKLAESIYRITQPYRYATFLLRHEKRPKEALPIFKDLALNGSPEDRRWSYNMWGQAVEVSEGNSEAGLRMYLQAHAADPDATTVHVNLASALSGFGRYEEALQIHKDRMAHLISGKTMTLPAVIPRAKKRTQANIDALLGAYHDALPIHAEDVRSGLAGYGSDALLSALVRDQIGEHDLVAARTSQAQLPTGALADQFKLGIAFGAQDWTPLLGLSDAMAEYLKAQPNDRPYALVQFTPPLALAQAHLGRFAAAERTIAATPGNCYPCLVTRAQVADLQGHDARADFWFARAAAAGPSIPFAYHEWGKVLLARGQPDVAIEKFKLANQKGPHFADPIEMWGEALMVKNQSHLALAKFAEAEKYTPNWGRLHLKWGEALVYARKKDEAKKQFARTGQLDLTPTEKTELAQHP
jgi:tetratricopeptide (TPR) repeat protein